ncbi:hypothetical protein [Ruegeria sp. Ofav3-42]|uniref:hypothetical protein n=1 Tax=Ruegeria sp. Ofav3-42 TaxID=2917759 RepID=UPI001EF53AD9|nr:hypothetical protein [Ruegeria sp. Ofav3-42]MCG7521942.1 hypothetical protein [Ruegeria sp. Ofav3-42]
MQSTHIPSQSPPKRKFPVGIILIWGALGLLVVFGKPYLMGDPAVGKAGPKYTSGTLTWQSYDPTWSTLLGEYALDMKVNPLRIRGSDKVTFTVTGTLLRSLCGSVLTKLPDPPDGVTRGDVYRLGFRFFEVEGGAPTNIYPVQVQDGACRAFDDQLVFDWSYPGQLTGWSPVQYEKSADDEITFTFGRRGETKVPYDQVDLKLACDVLFKDAPDKMREMLDETKTVNIRVVKGLVSGIGWVGLYKSQRFHILYDVCHPSGEVFDG